MSGKAYKFPTPIDPGGYRCIRVYIPDDTLYLAAFWRAYSFFGEWIAWQRDADHNAKDVAEIWRTGIEQSRQEYEEFGDCDVLDFRQNPSNKCQLQYSKDGGTTWLLMFDYSLCVDNPTLPPVPGGGGSGGGAVAANNIINKLYVPTMRTMLDYCDGSKNQAIAQVTEQIRVYDHTYTNPAVLGEIYDQVCGLSTEEQAILEDDCKILTWLLDQFEGLASCPNMVDDLGGWLDCASAWFSDQLNNAATELEKMLNAAAAALTGQGLVNYASGGDGGGGFGEFKSGGCAYALVPMVAITKTVPAIFPDGQQDCDTWEYTIPTGYELVAMYIKHDVSGYDIEHGVYIGADLSCGITPPSGGYVLINSGLGGLPDTYISSGVLSSGEPSSIFTDVGFVVDNPGLIPMYLTASDLQGEIDVKIAATWDSSEVLSITGTVKPILILRAV